MKLNIRISRYDLALLITSVSFMQLVAAITYQIVPADTHYAEIPLAAVGSIYQHRVSLWLTCLIASVS